MMRISEIMNRNVILLSPKMTIREAYEIFMKNNISGAPVVEDGKLVGILTLKDILKVIKDRMESVGLYVLPTPFDFLDIIPYQIPVESRESFKDLSNILVEEVMRRRVHYVTPDSDVLEALDMLVRKGISRLPVVDENMKVVGIVTRSDILRALANSDGVS